MFKNPLVYPFSGLLSLAVGIWIIGSRLNVHSGEIFLFLIGPFGFVVIIPIMLFTKSIQVFTFQYILLLLGFLLLSCVETESKVEKCLVAKYPDSSLEFFLSVIEDRQYIRRWNSDISISYEGTLNETEIRFLDSLIIEFTPLMSDINIKRVTSDGNIRFHFVKTFRNKDVASLPGSGRTFTSSEGKPNSLQSVDIWISPFLTNDRKREMMQHEFMHAIGFGHLKKQGTSIMAESKRYNSLDDYIGQSSRYRMVHGDDSVAVRILYDSCMSVGITPSVFRRALEVTHSRKEQ